MADTNLGQSMSHIAYLTMLYRLCDSLSTFVSVFTIKRSKGASLARALVLIKVKTPQYVHTPVYWLSS